jgi:hypothetical protein
MKKIFAALVATLATVQSASRVVAALEFGDKPLRRDLERLGIDPARFAAVRHA